MLLPKNSKDVPALRTFLTTLRTQACSASEGFGESLKTMANELVAKLDGFIGELPKEEVCGDWSLENHLDSLFAMLAQASAIASMAGLELAKLRSEAAEAGVQLAGQITAAIEEKVKAGELLLKPAADLAVEAALKAQTESGALVPKDTVTQLCADARALGIQEGEKKVLDAQAVEAARVATLATRRQALQTAGLPLPEADCEAVLGGTDEEFAAVQTQFQTRLAKLQQAGIQLAASPLITRLYLPEDQYGAFEKIVVAIPALKGPPVEVLATPRSPEPAPGKPSKFIV